MIRALTAIAAAVAICAPAAHAVGRATPVRCGDVITRDIRLANDLVDCPADGLVIGAPGITLDLGGHTIDGDAAAAGGEEVDVGIENPGHARVTIEEGGVREFDVGVSLPEVTGNRVRGLKVSRNAILGLDLDFSHISTVERSAFTDNGAAVEGPGIFVIGSERTLIEDNLIARNGGTGLVQLQSSGTHIDDNAILSNAHEGLFLGESEGNRVARNFVARNAVAGVLLETDRTTVTGNRVRDNGDNIVMVGDGNAVTGNHVAGARGCPDGCGFGISLEGGRGNLIAHNSVLDSRRAGIRVASFAPETPETVDNEIRRNVVRRAGEDGILIEQTAAGTLLASNRAFGAGDDGIDVESAETVLTRNTANHNRDLGIEAVPGVTSGGGNTARGNGNRAQCTGIACAPCTGITCWRR